MTAYDERLLASVPVVTDADRQEGYNIDLLEGNGTSRALKAGSPTPAPTPGPGTLAASADHAETGYHKEHDVYNVAPTPWYKTKKWIIIFVIGLIVLIGICVGVPVGVTSGHKNNKLAATATRATIGPTPTLSSTTAPSPSSSGGTGTGGGTGVGGSAPPGNPVSPSSSETSGILPSFTFSSAPSSTSSAGGGVTGGTGPVNIAGDVVAAPPESIPTEALGTHIG